MPRLKKFNKVTLRHIYENAACQRISSTIKSTIDNLQARTGQPRISEPIRISTISSQVGEMPRRESNHNPQMDNFGLYALKCDRNAAKKGLILNIPAKIGNPNWKNSPESTLARNQGQIVAREMNHEKFEPVEEVLVRKVVPPPRKKKRIVRQRQSITRVSLPQDEIHTSPVVNQRSIPQLKELPIRQESVNIFYQPQNAFEDFDEIFRSESPKEREFKPPKRVVQMRLAFSSTDLSSSDSGTPELRKMSSKPRKRITKYALVAPEEVVQTKAIIEQTKIERIVFQDQFIPNSFTPPPDLPPSQPPKTCKPVQSFLTAMIHPEPETIRRHNAPMITGDHYISEDTLVWTF